SVRQPRCAIGAARHDLPAVGTKIGVHYRVVMDLGIRSFRAAQAARFTQFFNASISFSISLGSPDIGSIVAFKVARRSTATICRNDHSLSHSPITARSSSASGNARPAVTYHTMMTLCTDHTHGATFSTASPL